MIVKLTHPDPNKEVWVELTDISAMERNHRPKSLIIRTDDDEPELTICLLRSGKHITCKELPSEIVAMMV